MNEPLRIVCPDSDLSKERRIEELMNEIKTWLYSDSLKKMISLFGGDDLLKTTGKDFVSDVVKIRQFAAVWDYRAGKERWAVKDDGFVSAHEDEIMESAVGLGLKTIVTAAKEPDYLLPLGGARASNRVRPEMSRRLIDENGWENKKVFALSGARPISETERPYMEYAPGAVTEFDAMNKGLEAAYGVTDYTEDRHDDPNVNLCSAIRRYDQKYKGCEICSMAAPSSDPEHRRANSADTFDFFADKVNVSEGDKMLLVTSCIYVPFQSLKFMDLAIEKGFEVDCVGSDIVDNFTLSKTSNYLQETKGTIDAIYGLAMKYCDN